MITIYGASDDLIEIEGDWNEEFSLYIDGNDDDHFLACSDGTMIKITYEDGGKWRFQCLNKGSAFKEIFNCQLGELEGYSDKVIFDGKLVWVALCEEFRAPLLRKRKK